MPKKKRSVTLEINSGTIEKSLSSPEISEIGRELSRIKPEELSNRQEVTDSLHHNDFQKQRKGSWISRLLRTFRIRRRRTTEPGPQPQINPGIQKSPSAQFYTAPPEKFLVEVTSKSDDVDGPEELNDAQSSEEIRASPVVSSIKLYKKPPNPASISELKKRLNENKKEDEIIKKDDEVPRYSNISELNNPGSSRRRPLSAESTSLKQNLSDLDEIYEVTWIFKDNNKKPSPILKSSSQIIDKRDIDIPDVISQPIEPLHKFPKPKPPVNRRPSTRRGSQPDVIIRRKSSDSGSVINRRSNAELEDVIKRLSEIPAPDTIPTKNYTPTPRKRTKFFKSPPESPTEKDAVGEENKTKLCLPSENNNISKNFEPEIDRPNISVNGLENNQINDQVTESKPTVKENINYSESETTPKHKKPTITRNQSFPAVKISQNKDAMVLLVGTLKNDMFNKEKGDNEEDEKDEPFPLKRWNTMPTRFYFNTRNLIHQSVDPSTILVLPVKDNTLIDDDSVPKIAVVLNADVRPPTQNTSTQTCSLLTEEAGEEMHLTTELLEAISDSAVSTEIKEDGQNTPPNTPEQDSENIPPSSIIDGNFSREDNSSTIQFKETSTSVRHVSSNTSMGSVAYFGNKELTTHKDTYETVSNYQRVDVKESESSNDTFLKLRSNLKHVYTRDNVYSQKESILSDGNSSKEGSVSCVKESLISNQTVIKAHNQEAPIKPLRVYRKPPTCPKPLLLPKPQDFVRRGALRQKKNSTSEDKTSSAIYNPHSEKLTNTHISVYNSNIRRSSLSPEENNDQASNSEEESLSIQRAKRRSKSIV